MAVALGVPSLKVTGCNSSLLSLPTSFPCFSAVSESLDYDSPEAIVGHYDTTVINFGGSEHFVYDNAYLGSLFDETAKFFNSVRTKRNVLLFLRLVECGQDGEALNGYGQIFAP